MSKQKLLFLKIALPLALLFFTQASVLAALVPCTGSLGTPTPCTVCHLLQMIANIVFFLVKNVMPPLAGLLFLVGGIMMIASAGSEERYKKGRQILVNVALGAAIVLCSWVIINAIITTIGTSSVNGFSPGSWWSPPGCS